MAVPARKQAMFWGIGFALFAWMLWALGSTLVPFVLGAAIAICSIRSPTGWSGWVSAGWPRRRSSRC